MNFKFIFNTRHLIMASNIKKRNFYIHVIHVVLRLAECTLFFISVFILLTRRKATDTLYIRQAITPNCFRRCQDIAVRLQI